MTTNTAATAASAEDLGQVVSLNEAAKQLLRRSFEINLSALNAIVQSKRSGGRLRGFDEASSQIRTWSGELHQLLQHLGGLGQRAVTLGSGFLRQKRMVGLFAQAAHLSNNGDARRVTEDTQASLASQRLALRGVWRQISLAIDDLNQLGLMACVLARSAMIEATAADAEQRPQLEELTKDFYAKSDEVVGIVRTLTETARSMT